MSIGNLKDSGNQGNNMPWQWQVLKGLQAILDEASQPLTCDDEVTVCGTTFTGGSLNTNITNGAGASAVNIQDGGNSITVDIVETQFSQSVIPRILLSSTSSNPTGSIIIPIYSISFASNGTVPALVSTDEGANYQAIPAGTTINFDAGGLGWYYEEDKFYWDTTAAGASLIITYNSYV